MSKPRLVEYNGEIKAAHLWAKQYGIESNTLIQRLNGGWPIEKALTQPVKKISRASEIVVRPFTEEEKRKYLELLPTCEVFALMNRSRRFQYQDILDYALDQLLYIVRTFDVSHGQSLKQYAAGVLNSRIKNMRRDLSRANRHANETDLGDDVNLDEIPKHEVVEDIEYDELFKKIYTLTVFEIEFIKQFLRHDGDKAAAAEEMCTSVTTYGFYLNQALEKLRNI